MRRALDWLPPRLRHMLLGWASVGCAYSLGSLWPRRAIVLPELAVDRWIPFNPAAIWLYASFFLIVPAAYLFASPGRLLWLQRAMQWCALAAGAAFLLWPTTLAYPPIVGDGGHAEALRFFLRFDTPHNCLPSLHGALTALAAWALWDGVRRWRSWLALAWALAILFSVIQLRRHLFIDLSAGVALGLLCGLLAARPDTVFSFSYRRT
ncbi:phosphatase PAP2 family protein [Chromobacterium vaccinii]|uniref:phosphatase PAP2 family protein n=1 Tax=Chromobacterium vaccinii TaxID=1108595 RepID=UPI001E401E39|nr:phosphatase PAP2 family protein [Chromobacterium vaccinii]MCD4486330.1 phosphatase PAP2 family protein [Chromobacterium vaccinii]